MTTEQAIESLGFFNEVNENIYPYGEYYNEKGNAKICLKGDGIYAYTVGTYENEDYLEMHLNFIPKDTEILKYLIRHAFCIS